MDKYGLVNFSIEDVVLKTIRKSTIDIDSQFNNSILSGMKRKESKSQSQNINWKVFTLNSNENNLIKDKKKINPLMRKKIMKSFKEKNSSQTDQDNLPNILKLQTNETTHFPLKKKITFNNCPFRGVFFLKLNKKPKN